MKILKNLKEINDFGEKLKNPLENSKKTKTKTKKPKSSRL